MPRPHYPPETCVKVTLLNFMVTQEGLQDQMLNIVVELEEPAKAEARSKAIVLMAQKLKVKKDLQDLILGLVSNAGDDILEDRKLKETLD